MYKRLHGELVRVVKTELGLILGSSIDFDTLVY